MTMALYADIYGSAACIFCEQAKSLLTERGVPFAYLDLDEEKWFDDLVSRIGSWKTVPQIFLDGEHIGGFDTLKEKLGET